MIVLVTAAADRDFRCYLLNHTSVNISDEVTAGIESVESREGGEGWGGEGFIRLLSDSAGVTRYKSHSRIRWICKSRAISPPAT